MCDNSRLISFLSVPGNVKQYLIYSIGVKHFPPFEDLLDTSIDYIKLIYWLQQQIEDSYLTDVQTISSQLISSQKCAELYESLCREILLSKDNSSKLVFHTVTLIIILGKIVMSPRCCTGTKEYSHRMINILCSTLKQAHNFARLRKAMRYSLVVVLTLILAFSFFGHGY